MATVEKWNQRVDGTRFPPHTHNVEKMDAVLSGHFRITIGEEEVVLGPGDAMLVPRGAEHSAEVVGSEPVISLDTVKVATGLMADGYRRKTGD